jgi:hypothetical protein
MTPEQFQTLMQPVTRFIAGKPVNAGLAGELNDAFPGDGETVKTIERACNEALAAGWKRSIC